MIDAKLLNRVLWGLNVVLVAGILVFSFQYLLRASDNTLLKDLKQDDDGPRGPAKPRDEGDGALKTLTNPIEKSTGPGKPIIDLPFKADLKGTLPSEKEPKRGVAFIKSRARNVELVAYVDEELLQDGKPYEEYRGWTLASVTRDRAIFVSKKGEKVELTIDLSMSVAPSGPASGPTPPGVGTRGSRIGAAYTSESYKSRLLASADTRQVWGLDQDEIDWAGQNADQILDRDFQVSPYAGGGLRLEGVTAGSIGAARGLLAGDVLREVNGQALNNISDIRTLMNNP
ncbi:MAG TPA: PDZ domain-containing protein, partial [Planctomycetota bacterium]|nr:PDZ domain-containing protein [Planctomycetota bacterium]